jgi:hypothetical protein
MADPAAAFPPTPDALPRAAAQAGEAAVSGGRRRRGVAVINPGDADQRVVDFGAINRARQPAAPAAPLALLGPRAPRPGGRSSWPSPEEQLAALDRRAAEAPPPPVMGGPHVATVPTVPPPGLTPAAAAPAFQPPTTNLAQPAPAQRVFFELSPEHDPIEAYFERVLDGPGFLVLVRPVGHRGGSRFMPTRGGALRLVVEGAAVCHTAQPTGVHFEHLGAEYCVLAVLEVAPLTPPAPPEPPEPVASVAAREAFAAVPRPAVLPVGVPTGPPEEPTDFSEVPGSGGPPGGVSVDDLFAAPGEPPL